MSRVSFVRLDPQAAEKAFAQRRAGLAPPDDAADHAFVATLRVLEPALPRQAWHLRTVRELTSEERARYIAGQVLGVEVVREDLWAGRVAAKSAVDNDLRRRRAARAASEARRLAAEASREP